MGNGVLGGRKKMLTEEERQRPLTTAAQVLGNLQAKERVIACCKIYQPGVTLRWEKILAGINREVEPTKEEMDPLRLRIDITELKSVLRQLFHEVRYISSDGLALCREFMPKLYDKHTVERGQQVSMLERTERGLSDNCFAYGELDFEIFATMYLKIISVYGAMDGGVFYDLGCGVGTLVYTAAFIGSFKKVIGVDYIRCLLERGVKRRPRWDNMKTGFTSKVQEIDIAWIEDDFTQNDFWAEATFIILHWTALESQQWGEVSEMMVKCVEGAHVITFTNPLNCEDFDLLLVDTCDTSWGKTEFYFHEKITPSRMRRPAVPPPAS